MKKNYIILFAILILQIQAKSQWQPTNGSIANETVTCLAVSGSNIYAGTASSGVFLSSNDGATWTAINTGLPSLEIVKIIVNGTNVFVGTASKGVFMSSNNGASWTSKNAGLSANSSQNISVKALLKFGSNIYVGYQISDPSYGGFYMSSDNGTSWMPKNQGIAWKNPVGLCSNGTILFACTSAEGVFKSTDNGNNWININNTWSGASIIFSDENNLYYGRYNSSFIMSTDNGANWSGVVGEGLDVKSMFVYDSKLFVGGYNYLSFSNPIPDVWTSVKTGLPNLNISDLVINGSYMFAATSGKGVYKRLLTELVGIEEVNINDFELYPSIASSSITILCKTNTPSNIIAIFNMQGQLMMQQTTDQIETEIDISSISSGLYLIKYITPKGTSVKKFIKE